MKLTMVLAGDEVIAEADTACGGARSWVEVRQKYLDANILLFSAFLDDETITRAEEIGVVPVSKDDLKDLPDLARRRAA